MFKVVFDLIRYNREFTIGAILTAIVIIMACLSFISPYPPSQTYVVLPDMPPSLQNWFGTTSRGQDTFWQVTFALRNSLLFGVSVAIISRILSLLIGLVAGYRGGWIDMTLMSLNDTFLVIPLFPLLVMFYFVLRDHMNWFILAGIMGLLGWPFDARLIRSVTLSLKTREFTTQSVFSGMSTGKILIEEHLPYVLPIVFATTLANINWSIGLEVTLSVLGFTDVNTPTIGTMLYWANQHSAMISGNWSWLAAPTVFVIIAFIGLFLLSISMNEYIDPRSRLARMGT